MPSATANTEPIRPAPLDPGAAVQKEWAHCREWFGAGDFGGQEAAYIAALEKGEAQLWRGELGAILTKLAMLPSPHASIIGIGGDIADALNLLPAIESWASAQHAPMIAHYVSGHPQRIFQSRGWLVYGDAVGKPLQVFSDGAIERWNACREWLLPALVDATEPDVIRELETGASQLWMTSQAALVTHLVASSEPFVHGWLGGGSLENLMSLAPGVMAWARGQGAKAARIRGRPGWSRALRGMGFVECDDGELWKAL